MQFFHGVLALISVVLGFLGAGARGVWVGFLASFALVVGAFSHLGGLIEEDALRDY